MDDDDDGLDGLEAEFPGWTCGTKWTEAGSGPGGRLLLAWRDGMTVTGWTVDGLRRQIRQAGG